MKTEFVCTFSVKPDDVSKPCCTLTQSYLRDSLICDGKEEARKTCPLWR